MNPRRLILALVVALLLSGAVTFLINRKLGNRVAAPHTLKVVAAAKNIDSGEVIKAETVQLVDWPASVPLQGGFAKPEDVIGRSTIYPISSGQPVLATQLAAPGSGIGLTVKIPEGMRAVSVKSDEIVGVAGFLFPGSHVDVLVTLRGDNGAKPQTDIVLQDVEVLTAGQNIEPDPQGKPQTVSVVTVLLAPPDAQKLMLATTQGGIEFVLRNGADRGRIKSIPIQIASLSSFVEPTRKVSSGRGPERSTVKSPYVVETIMGDKRVRAQFE